MSEEKRLTMERIEEIRPADSWMSFWRTPVITIELRQLCDLALSALSQEAVRDEAWLIERGEAPWIEYWGGEHIRLWTKDVYKAVWFPTELAAKTVGWEMRVHPGTGSETRVIQHGFAALKREPNAADEK